MINESNPSTNNNFRFIEKQNDNDAELENKNKLLSKHTTTF